MNRHHNCRRAVLAACLGSIAAFALGTSGSALASVACRAPGYASGSSFQSVAQKEVWLTSTGWGAHSSCSIAPTSSTMTYTKTASGPGLEEFGNLNGQFKPEKDPTAFAAASPPATKDVAGQVLDWYVGTDDPPNARELGEAKVAAGAKNPAEITIPVAQAPVTVMLSLPAGCKIQSGSAVNLNNTTIGQLWEGTNAPSGEDPGGVQAQGGYSIATWGAFLTQLGYTKITSGTPEAGQFLDEEGATGCGQAIKPQVRQTTSGTSYAFKSYLAQINPGVWSGFASDFVSWPSGAVVTSDPKTPPTEGTQLNDSGGHLAANTAANPGSVGYAVTADAAAAGNGGFTSSATSSTFGVGGSTASHQILWAEIQNNGTSTEGATYEDPRLAPSSIANCESTKLIPSDEGFPYSYTDSWAGILVSDPNIAAAAGPTDYPICALTYDLVFHHYSNKNLYGTTETAHEVANTVKDLFEYITGQGQIDIQSHDYTRFPTGFASHVKLAVNPGIGY